MLTNRLFCFWIVATLAIVTACSPQVAATSEPASAEPTTTPGTTSAPEEAVTLRLAVADEEGRPSDPYVHEFIDQVKTLSNGTITIEPTWDAGSATEAGFETGVIQLVQKGGYDLGLAASRAFDNESITSFQALQAPFLMDNDALSKAVATSDIATQMLDNLSPAGITGLTLWPEDLRHPFSLVPGKTILSVEDFKGTNVRTTPSNISYRMIEALGGKPMFGDGEFQAAESGLRQGASLGGTPTATGNVIFFAKFQVLFANGPAFEKLNETQRNILHNAAMATQKKAIAEHPSDIEAANAWCADGGSIVLASDAQVAAFTAAAQPVFDQIEQDANNAELIAAIRELKAKTEPSPRVEACAPAPVTTLDHGQIPPELVGTWSFTAFGESWKVELTADGTFSLYGPDGKFDVGGSYSILGSEAVFRDEKRGTGTLCFPAEGRYHWELTESHLKFTVIEDKCTVGRIEQWTAGWQKVEEVWSQGLPPNGKWTVNLTAEDVVAKGVLQSKATGWAGSIFYEFQGGQGTFRAEYLDGGIVECTFTYEAIDDFFRITYSMANPDCGNEVDDLQWRLDEEGQLYFHVINIKGAPLVENKAVYEAKPWQKVE